MYEPTQNECKTKLNQITQEVLEDNYLDAIQSIDLTKQAEIVLAQLSMSGDTCGLGHVIQIEVVKYCQSIIEERYNDWLIEYHTIEELTIAERHYESRKDMRA